MSNVTAKLHVINSIHIRLINLEFAYNKYGEEGKVVHYELAVDGKNGNKVFEVQEVFVPLADPSHLKEIDGLDLLSVVEAINKKDKLWASASEILDNCFTSKEPVDIIEAIKHMRNSQIGLPDLLTLKIDFEDVYLDSISELRDRVDFQVSVNILGKEF